MYITGKKARSYVNKYESICTPLSLDDVYKSYSAEKQRVWGCCQRICDRMNGRRLTVLSHNSNFLPLRLSTRTPTQAFSCSTSKHTQTATIWKCEVQH